MNASLLPHFSPKLQLPKL